MRPMELRLKAAARVIPAEKAQPPGTSAATNAREIKNKRALLFHFPNSTRL